MENQDEILLRDFPEVHPYITLFQRHLHQVQQHLSGTSPKNAMGSSFLGGVHWEPLEKDAFFHALGAYSRLRPDLIASCIGTKNQAEVLEYMAVLEQGLQDNCEEGFIQRENFPLAHEVSDAWLIWEEENAERLQVNEEIWATNSYDKISGGPEHAIDSPFDVSTPAADRRLGPPLGGISCLTYGHLAVLDLILKADESEHSSFQGENLCSESGGATISVGSANRAEPKQLTQTLQSSALPDFENMHDSDSLDKLALTMSQPRLDPPAEEERNPLELTPQSRRRYMKRMHMRQKRAQTTGATVDKTAGKLRPGPRKKLFPSSITSSGSDKGLESKLTSDTTSNAMSEGQEFASTSCQTGLTGLVKLTQNKEDGSNIKADRRIPYKTVLSEFQQRRVDAGCLEAAGLDLFNHKTLGRLTRQFISGYNSDLIDADVSLHTETLILLSEIVKDYLVQIIGRVIVLEEEHRRLRGKTKVWGNNTYEKERVDKSAIQFVLKSLGIKDENLDQYFAGLLAEDHCSDSHQLTGYADNERLVDGINDFHRHPLHLDLCPPHYLTLGQSLPWLSSEGGGNDIQSTTDNNADQEGSDGVLSEEEALDKEDALADTRYENALWEQIPLPKRRRREFNFVGIAK